MVENTVDIDNLEAECNCCKVWLARAGLCLLALAIRSASRGSDEEFSPVQSLCDLLIGHFKPWQHLTLDLPLYALARHER